MKFPANLQKLAHVEQGIWKVKDLNSGTDKFFVFVSVRDPVNPGRRPSRQSVVNNVTEARQNRKDFLRELEDLIADGPSTTFSEFIPAYYRYIEGCKKESSIIREKSSIQAHFVPLLGAKPMKQITSEDCEQLLLKVCDGKSTQTYCHLLSHLSSIFKRARKLGVVGDNPCELIERPKRKHAERLVLSEPQIKTLLDHLRENHSLIFYHVALAYFTGCRAGELRALVWSDVQLEGQRKTISISKSLDAKSGKLGTTKTAVSRVITISEPLQVVLKELQSITYTAPTDSILPYWREFHAGEQAKSLKIVCRSLGLPSIRFHDLRSCTISHMLVNGVSLAATQLWNGHASIKSTQVYLRYTGVEADGASDSLKYRFEDLKKTSAIDEKDEEKR